MTDRLLAETPAMNSADTDTADESQADKYQVDDQDLVHPDHAQDLSSAAVDSPGRALAAARRARKLEVVRVATELRLKPETIDALERDDYDHLPSPVFVSGYIRTYARLLGMDPQPLIARFHVLHPGAEAPPRSALENQELARSGSGWTLPLLLSAVVLIGAGGYLWWAGSQVDPYRAGISGTGPDQGIAGTEPSKAAQPDDEAYDESFAAPTTTVDTERDTDGAIGESGTALTDLPSPSGDGLGTVGAKGSTPSLDDAAANAVSSTGSSTDNAPIRPSPDVELLPQPGAVAGLDASAEADAPGPDAESNASVDEPASETAAEDAPNAGQVVVSFSGPCWVDVRDAAGEVQLFGEMADGDRHVLGGEPPYSLVIGNASAVTMTVGGTPFDVSAIAKGNVARFELDPAEIVGGPASPGASPSPSDD